MCLEMNFCIRIYLVYIYVPEFCRETRSHVPEFAPDARVIAVGMPHVPEKLPLCLEGIQLKEISF